MNLDTLTGTYLIGIEPWGYLQRVIAELPQAETIEDVEVLVPHRVKPGKEAVH